MRISSTSKRPRSQIENPSLHQNVARVALRVGIYGAFSGMRYRERRCSVRPARGRRRLRPSIETSTPGLLDPLASQSFQAGHPPFTTGHRSGSHRLAIGHLMPNTTRSRLFDPRMTVRAAGAPHARPRRFTLFQTPTAGVKIGFDFSEQHDARRRCGVAGGDCGSHPIALREDRSARFCVVSGRFRRLTCS